MQGCSLFGGWCLQHSVLWRLGLVLIALAFVGLFFPQPSEAGVGSCLQITRDADVDVPPFNYVWFASASCIGENWDGAQINVSLQYYDWDKESWRYLQYAGGASQSSDDDILAWGAQIVEPFQGINCRRVRAGFAFQHSGRSQSFILHSNGECY